MNRLIGLDFNLISSCPGGQLPNYHFVAAPSFFKVIDVRSARNVIIKWNTDYHYKTVLTI